MPQMMPINWMFMMFFFIMIFIFFNIMNYYIFETKFKLNLNNKLFKNLIWKW